jgi:hypothetical protein
MATDTRSMASTDPFNWPSLKRADLMSLDTLSRDKDLWRTKTAGAT